MLPDINVWVALTLPAHEHHDVAWRWYRTLRQEELLSFCRVTQMGFLRLMTNAKVAGDLVQTQAGAWKLYDGWLLKGGAAYQKEPLGFEMEFRFYASRQSSSTAEWTDSYLLAFAASTSVPLITFDKALSQRYARGILLIP